MVTVPTARSFTQTVGAASSSDGGLLMADDVSLRTLYLTRISWDILVNDTAVYRLRIINCPSAVGVVPFPHLHRFTRRNCFSNSIP